MQIYNLYFIFRFFFDFGRKLLSFSSNFFQQRTINNLYLLFLEVY